MQGRAGAGREYHSAGLYDYGASRLPAFTAAERTQQSAQNASSLAAGTIPRMPGVSLLPRAARPGLLHCILLVDASYRALNDQKVPSWVKYRPHSQRCATICELRDRLEDIHDVSYSVIRHQVSCNLAQWSLANTHSRCICRQLQCPWMQHGALSGGNIMSNFTSARSVGAGATMPQSSQHGAGGFCARGGERAKNTVSQDNTMGTAAGETGRKPRADPGQRIKPGRRAACGHDFNVRSRKAAA